MEIGTGRRVDIRRLSKRYGRVAALDDVSLSVRPGEFLSLVGPSGSGKSTILMTVAGFETPDTGEILIDGRNIDRLPPHRRDIGLIFQRYALFPHMNVADNVAYPLWRRGVDRDEVARRVDEALALVKLSGFGGRQIHQLSGGQQQRVAIARALVFRPGVLLMDEPMSALDKRLRQHMQIELKLLQKELGATIVLVTHDQEEALSMADRVAVLDEGRLRQVDTPAELYRRPADAFVADFIGRTNFLPLEADSPPRIAGFASPLAEALAPDSAAPGSGLCAGVRPEHVRLARPGGAGESARVIEGAFGGATQLVLVDVAGHRLTAEVPAGADLWQPGDAALLAFDRGSVRLFQTPSLASHRKENRE